MTPEQIQQIRRVLGEDTVRFGERFGRSGRTVEAWEQGLRQPDPLVLKELDRIVRAKRKAKHLGDIVTALHNDSPPSRAKRAAKR